MVFHLSHIIFTGKAISLMNILFPANLPVVLLFINHLDSFPGINLGAFHLTLYVMSVSYNSQDTAKIKVL